MKLIIKTFLSLALSSVISSVDADDYRFGLEDWSNQNSLDGIQLPTIVQRLDLYTDENPPTVDALAFYLKIVTNDLQLLYMEHKATKTRVEKLMDRVTAQNKVIGQQKNVQRRNSNSINVLKGKNSKLKDDIVGLKQDNNANRGQMNAICDLSPEGTCDSLKVGPNFQIENTLNDNCISIVTILPNGDKPKAWEACYSEEHGYGHRFYVDPKIPSDGTGPHFKMDKYDNEVTTENFVQNSDGSFN